MVSVFIVPFLLAVWYFNALVEKAHAVFISALPKIRSHPEREGV
jgi:hypothetical protein